MLPPLPRCSSWAYSSLIHPAVSAFPGRGTGSACTSTFSRFAQRSLALRPAHSRGHQIRDRYPGASDISSPPCLPRLLPAGAIAGRGLHPLESAALSRRTWFWVIPDLLRFGCPFSKSGHLRTEATTPNRSQGIIAPSEPCRTFGSRARRSDRMKDCPLLQAAID